LLAWLVELSISIRICFSNLSNEHFSIGYGILDWNKSQSCTHCFLWLLDNHMAVSTPPPHHSFVLVHVFHCQQQFHVVALFYQIFTSLSGYQAVGQSLFQTRKLFGHFDT
jgi:hypothetical protein